MKNRNQFLKPSTAALVVGSLAVANGAWGQAIQPGVSAITPVTSQIEVGPILDVVPYVLADGYTINLTLIPSDTEFDGYDNPVTAGPPIPTVTAGLNVVQLPVVLPTFTIRQESWLTLCWNGLHAAASGAELRSSDARHRLFTDAAEKLNPKSSLSCRCCKLQLEHKFGAWTI
jgi:hypothetical protein